MSHAKNKVGWCVKKASRELESSDTHRGLVKDKPDIKLAEEHLNKAEHYLKATTYLKTGNFSDISASTAFYCMYHSLLAIAAKFGYESRNQECTFALIYSLIEEGDIDFDENMMHKITVLDPKEGEEQTSVKLREQFQYGTSVSMEDTAYEELFELARDVLEQSREILKG